MTDPTEDLVSEILRRLQAGVADIKAGQQDVVHRLTLVETGVERNLARRWAA